MNAIQALSACTNPLQTAMVFNPTRPEYYRADEQKPTVSPDADSASVTITLSAQARQALSPASQPDQGT
jgi:hypothetical protein